MAQRWLVAGGSRRRVFALLCCGVGDSQYALFCRDMGAGGRPRRAAAPHRCGGVRRGRGRESRNYELWGRSLGSVSGRPV